MRKHATQQGLILKEQEAEANEGKEIGLEDTGGEKEVDGWTVVETEEEKGSVLESYNRMSETKNMGYLDFGITKHKSPFLFVLYICDSDKV